MKKVVVLISVDITDSRGKAEDIENQDFKTNDAILDAICKNKEHPPVLIYELTDFMDECNNQEINLENWFITYVNVPKDTVIR